MQLDLGAIIKAAGARRGDDVAAINPVDLEGLRLFLEDARAVAGRQHAADSFLFDWLSIWIYNAAGLEKESLQNPEPVPIPAPVFIVSAARTGSTFLQTLLALDSGLRTPRLWEVRRPVAAQGSAFEKSAMIAATEAFVAGLPARMRILHPMSAQAPAECHWLLRHNSSRAAFHVCWRYWSWLKTLDRRELRRLFLSYRQHLQMLQGSARGRRWLGKAPAHAFYWPVLFDVFPDAHVIRLHREPQQMLASACSLIQTMTPEADPNAIRDIVVDITVDGADRAIEAEAAAPPGAVTDILYEDLVAEPAQTIRWLAPRIGLSADEIGQKVDRYLTGRRPLRASRHTHDLAQFGLSQSEVNALCEKYIAWVRCKISPTFAR